MNNFSENFWVLCFFSESRVRVWGVVSLRGSDDGMESLRPDFYFSDEKFQAIFSEDPFIYLFIYWDDEMHWALINNWSKCTCLESIVWSFCILFFLNFFFALIIIIIIIIFWVENNITSCGEWLMFLIFWSFIGRNYIHVRNLL